MSQSSLWNKIKDLFVTKKRSVAFIEDPKTNMDVTSRVTLGDSSSTKRPSQSSYNSALGTEGVSVIGKADSINVAKGTLDAKKLQELQEKDKKFIRKISSAKWELKYNKNKPTIFDATTGNPIHIGQAAIESLKKNLDADLTTKQPSTKSNSLRSSNKNKHLITHL